MALFRHFFQGEIGSRPESGIQELLRAVLMRANFVPAVRYNIGWKGLRQSSAGGEWTARIDGFAGIFGLLFNGVSQVPGWIRGRFLLHFFPDPDEALIESCSLNGAAWTRDPEYMKCVRDFAAHPELSGNFAIGQVCLSVDDAGKALALELESLSALRTVAEDGVVLIHEGQPRQIIQPGGCDQDFPALEVASRFFNVLASSLSYNLEQPPSYLSEHRAPAAQAVYNRLGEVRHDIADDLWRMWLLLGYGEAWFEEIEVEDRDVAEKRERVHCWRTPAHHPSDYRDRLWWRAHQLQGYNTLDRKTLGIDERPPFIILSGFLGSGKTSFLQHFIEFQTQRSRFVAVIQNETGEIGLDGKLLDYTVAEIDEGCVCCNLAGSVKRAVKGILDEFSPDVIILETSGLANPKHLLDELGELAELVRFDAVVTMVDALNFRESIENYPIAAEQIASADVLLLNKKDLVDEKRLEELRGRLAEMNPHAPVLASCRGDVNPALIFDTDGRDGAGTAGDSHKPRTGRRRTHIDDRLWSQTIRIPKVLDRHSFLETVTSLPKSVFRIKGIVDLSDPRQTLLFQSVGGRYDISEFTDPRVADRFLIFIGKTECPDTLEDVEHIMRKIRFEFANCFTCPT